jgi:glycosyltransferase involved in cell wall biosynthesis
MSSPKVSIITSTYNDGKYIDQTIQSVLKQTLKDWEFVIYNDASTDNTEKILSQYLRDPRFVIINNKINLGKSANLKKAFKILKGEFIATLDGDDYWLSENKLQDQLNWLHTNSSVVMVGTYAHMFDDQENLLLDIQYPLQDQIIRQIMLEHNCFVYSSVMFRASILPKIVYLSDNDTSQDYALWLEIGRLGKMGNISDFLTAYRSNPKGLSQTKHAKQIKSTIILIEKYRKYYPGYYKARLLWQMRLLYPFWLRKINFKFVSWKNNWH